MVEELRGIETKPYLVALNEISVPKYVKTEFSKTEAKDIREVSAALKSWKFNFSLPIVCLSKEDNRYELLTGMRIYQASLDAELQRIWVFLVATPRAEAVKIVSQFALQSKLNEEIIEVTELDEKAFLLFINDKNSALTQVSGIGEGFAKQILAGQPYPSIEQFQKDYGKNRSLKWMRSFKQINKD